MAIYLVQRDYYEDGWKLLRHTTHIFCSGCMPKYENDEDLRVVATRFRNVRARYHCEKCGCLDTGNSSTWKQYDKDREKLRRNKGKIRLPIL